MTPFIKADLEKKMFFLGGPRQVGKTTLAQDIGKSCFSSYLYLNWDKTSDQQKILLQEFSPEHELIILDEIHKYEKWKNTVKGIYDTQKEKHKFLVTGSARLDLYRKGGDSLLGRYFYARLHPLSLAEVLRLPIKENVDPADWRFLSVPDTAEKTLQNLYAYGSFPEPYFEQDNRFTKRWQQERKKRLIREDIRDASNIRHLSILETMLPFLEERVASLFSINSLREDFGVHYNTLSAWIDVLENFYYLFRIQPYQSKKIRSLKKEPKIFLWDFSEVDDEGSRFENLIASHLLKFVHFYRDFFGENLELCYLRDQSKRETDFLITQDNKPFIAIEVKIKDTKVSTPLKYFQEKLSIPFCFQLVKKDGVDFEKNGVRVLSASAFLTALV